MKNLPDEAVIFQLEYHGPRQHGSALCRVEWKPIRPHNNKGIGPPEYRFMEIKKSHIHPFELNWKEATKQLRRGNLPIAIPIDLELQSFSDLLEFIGKEFRINNIDSIPAPGWEADLI